MINLTEEQYAAIGRVAVQSGTLEREVDEYIVRLKYSTPRGTNTLGPKLDFLHEKLLSHPTAKLASVDFGFTITTLKELIDKRNAVVHGVWSSNSNAPMSIGDTTAKGRKATIHASEVIAVADQLRLARKLLLRLCHDHCPSAVGNKKCPKSAASELKKQLVRATKLP